VAALRHGDELALPRPVVAELWCMVFNSSRVDQNRNELTTFLGSYPVVELDDAAAMDYGRIRVELKIGRPIPAMDVLIAANARASGST
jgi:predicted nucleic acid-binding protein